MFLFVKFLGDCDSVFDICYYDFSKDAWSFGEGNELASIDVIQFPDYHPKLQVDYFKLNKYLPSPESNGSNVSNWKLFIIPANRKTFLRQMHSDFNTGHLGVAKTMLRLVESYYRSKLRQSVSRYIGNCKICVP